MRHLASCHPFVLGSGVAKTVWDGGLLPSLKRGTEVCGMVLHLAVIYIVKICLHNIRIQT